MSKNIFWIAALRALVFFVLGSRAQAAEVRVAVAANFAQPMQKIAHIFAQEAQHKVLVSFGATGSFYAQIKNGAPFQILLAADASTPNKIEQEGFGVAGTRFTYAIGKLLLWSKRTNLVDDKGEILRSNKFQRIAIANPKLAPYGVAAIETLNNMSILQSVRSKFVQGENISQTYQFIASENAELGFIALSQVFADGKILQGSAWLVPAHMYSPIRQDAILLKERHKGNAEPAAIALHNFLRSDKAKAIIRSYGYDID